MDKNDIFWCLTKNGVSSLVASHPDIVFSPIEKGLSKYLVGKIVGLAKKGECIECIECIDYIIKHKTNQNILEIALFDLLMKEYVWHMGKVCYEQCTGVVQGAQWLYAMFNFLCRSKTDSIDNLSAKYDKAFVNVYQELNKYSYVILTNLMDPYGIITEEDYSELSEKYIVNSHVKFEGLIAPQGHKFAGQRFIDIIIHKSRTETSQYYKELYCNCIYLKGGFKGDYPKYFFDRIPDTIFGNEDIYK